MLIDYSLDSVDARELVHHLGFAGTLYDSIRAIMVRKEAQKKAKEIGLSVTVEDIQAFADRYRADRNLHSAAETSAFLSAIDATADEFEQFCAASVAVEKLKDHLATAGAVTEFFVNNRPSFDLARISRIVVRNRDLANELKAQVEEEGEDFHRLAREHSIDDATRYAGGYVGQMGRDQLGAEISAKVFNSADGELVGPFETSGVHQLILVEEVLKYGEDNEEIRKAIRERLFSEWASSLHVPRVKVDVH